MSESNAGRVVCKECGSVMLERGAGEVRALEAWVPDNQGDQGVVAVSEAYFVADMMSFFNIGVSNTITATTPLPEERTPVPIARFLTCADCPTLAAKVVGFIVPPDHAEHAGCWLFQNRVAVLDPPAD